MHNNVGGGEHNNDMSSTSGVYYRNKAPFYEFLSHYADIFVHIILKRVEVPVRH